MKTLWKMTLLLMLMSCLSCSVETAPVDTTRSPELSNASSDDANTDKGGNNNPSGDQSVEEGDDEEEDDDTNNNGNNGEDDETDDNGGSNSQAGLTYFENQLTEALTRSCTGCHADPRFMVEVQGPLTIFSYDQMKPLLEEGVSSTNNNFINKVQGIINHTGGDRCLSGLNVSPCKEIVQWWETEFGDDTTGGPAVRAGELTSVSDLGRVTGWALDPAQANTTVKLYANGPNDTGEFIMETAANLNGFDGGNGNSHAFAVTLPEAYRNGSPVELYAYAVVDGDEVLLPGAPKSIVAYAPSDGGRNFFENTLQPMLTNQCGGCHGVSYEQQFANLLQPSPAKGGTATNNLLYNKPSGNVAHGGPTFCNGGGNPCAQIQEWWELEFN